MNRLEKLKKELAKNHGVGIANPVLRSMISSMSRGAYSTVLADSFESGFDAASAEYEKIIAELEGALTNWMKFEEKSIAEDGHYVGKEFNALIKNAQDALQKLKDFKE